ncbi:unnamed protein product, partial [Strongylus vulgaris]
TRKEKSKELPPEPSRLPYSADNIIERRRDSHIFPTKDGIDHKEILQQSLPLINIRVKRIPHWRYHHGFWLLKYEPQSRP